MKTIIYYLYDKDGIPFYVGKTNHINDRKYKHKRKYGFDITMEILEEVETSSWRFWEAYYISLFKSWGFKLTNQNNGGGGLTTVNFSKDRNIKISMANKGKTSPNKNRSLTEEHKAKIKAKRGHLLGRKNTWQSHPVIQYDLEGNIVQEWESQMAAQIAFNKPKSDGIGAVCRGKQKTAYGFIWKFKNKI